MAGLLLQFMKTVDANGGGRPGPRYTTAKGETTILDDPDVKNDPDGPARGSLRAPV